MTIALGHCFSPISTPKKQSLWLLVRPLEVNCYPRSKSFSYPLSDRAIAYQYGEDVGTKMCSDERESLEGKDQSTQSKLRM